MIFTSYTTTVITNLYKPICTNDHQAPDRDVDCDVQEVFDNFAHTVSNNPVERNVFVGSERKCNYQKSWKHNIKLLICDV